MPNYQTFPHPRPARQSPRRRPPYTVDNWPVKRRGRGREAGRPENQPAGGEWRSAACVTRAGGVGRAIGVLANITWDRGLGYAIERPKSITMDMLEQAAGIR